MRVAAALLMLALAGCGRPRAPSDAAEYAEARRLLRSERYQEAAIRTEDALRRAPSDSVWHWKLRLLRVEILLARREAKAANALLSFELPSGPQWSAELARYRLCQGYAAALLHDFALAHSRLDQAQALAQGAGDRPLLAEIELRKGYVAVGEGRSDEARRRFEHVLEMAIRQNDAYLRMNATGNLGYLLLRSFQYDAAIPRFEETLASAQILAAAESQGRCMGNLGWCFYRLGDLDKALHYFQQADERFQSTGNRYERQLALGNIGTVFLDRNEYPAAGDYYQRALKIGRALDDRAHCAVWLNNLAHIAIDTGDLRAATAWNDEALAIKRELNDRQGRTYSVVNAARIALGNREYARSAALFRDALHANSDDPSPLLDAHAGLAELFAGTGHNKAAEDEFRATISAVERQRSGLLKDEYKLTWLASLIHFYQSYVEFLLARGNNLAALEVADASRARLMADKLGLTRLRKQTTAIDYQNIARRSGSILLSYWLSPGKSCLWVISGDGVSTWSLPPEAEIRRLVESHQRIIENLQDPLTTDDPAGAKLYALLIGPAEAAIRKTRRVILLPDGALYSLNFETLPVSAGVPHYWIEDAVVSITPSLRLLAPEASPERNVDTSLLLIGNPNSPGRDYPALPFAGQEMAAVENSLPASRKLVRSQGEAQPDAYRRADPGRFSLIHFVAHAVANRDEPLQSSVILSPQGDNYKLLARDIIGIPIHADLVTVSACRSAAGRTYAGEGLVGFSWAFLQAGARHVIASLWDVNDRSTAALMATLYGELGRGSTPPDALRSAKLAMIHSGAVWRKPWYWGPFQIYTISPANASSAPSLLTKK